MHFNRIKTLVFVSDLTKRFENGIRTDVKETVNRVRKLIEILRTEKEPPQKWNYKEAKSSIENQKS